MKKQFLKTFLFTTLVWLSAPLLAGVYKYVDENGNVVFTDTPPAEETIEEVKLPKIQTSEKYNAPLPRNGLIKPKPKPKSKEFTVTMSPASGETIRANGGQITLNAMLDPAPDFPVKTNFYLDGTLASTSAGTSGSVSNIDRGEHSFRVEVLNADSGETIGSASSQITILRASILRPQWQQFKNHSIN